VPGQRDRLLALATASPLVQEQPGRARQRLAVGIRSRPLRRGPCHPYRLGSAPDEGRTSGAQRVHGRPHGVDRLLRLGTQAGRTVRGHERDEPLLDELDEEPRRARRLRPVAPPAAAEQQPRGRSGHRDVGEPSLLGDLVLGYLRTVGDQPRGELGRVHVGGEVDIGQVLAVTAQHDGDRTHGPHPAVAVGVGREGALHEAGDGDDVPLQTLGSVHGHDLHGVRVGLGRRGGQAPLLGAGRREPGEEATEGATVLAVEARSNGTEGVQVHAGLSRCRAPHGDLDVEAEQPLGLDHEIGDREERLAPQGAQETAELGEARPPGRREAPVGPARPPRRRESVEGVGDRRQLAAVGAGVALGPGHLARPVVQGSEVGEPEPRPRTGEQAHQRVPARGVVRGLEQRDDVDDLRGVQESTDPGDLHLEPCGQQRLLEQRELRTGAAEHGRGHRSRTVGRQQSTLLDDEPRDGHGLVLRALQELRLHDPVARARPRHEHRQRRRVEVTACVDGHAQRSRNRIREREHGVVVAP